MKRRRLPAIARGDDAISIFRFSRQLQAYISSRFGFYADVYETQE